MREQAVKTYFSFVLVVVLLPTLGTRGSAAQESRQGPLTPPPKREVTRLPVEVTPEKPPVPVEEIIRRFTQKEDEFQRALGAYTFQKTIRVQEFGDDGKPAGEFQVATEWLAASDGKFYEKIVQYPPSTLRRMKLAPEDLGTLARMPAFAVTSDQLSKYEVTYAGKQPVDEITTYVFQVKPKQLERRRAYFEGLLWVDDRDLLVVKTYGKWVTETGDVASPELPFTLFETYRETIDGKYWFPTYARSDDTLKTKGGETRIRLTIRWTDYRPAASGISKAPGATSAAEPTELSVGFQQLRQAINRRKQRVRIRRTQSTVCGKGAQHGNRANTREPSHFDVFGRIADVHARLRPQAQAA